MEELIPFEDRVVVKPLENENVSKSGIVLDVAAPGRSNKGIVVSTGEKVTTSLSVGDVVLFDKRAGTETKINNEDLLVFHFGNIIGKLINKRGE